jgi:hypothetical protein
MGCTRCFTGSLLHILNFVDLVLGGSVLLFGLLLPLHWGMWDLIWMWVPLLSIGGLTLLMVFISWCGVMAREKQIGGSGGSLDPPRPLLEPPGNLLTHLHTVYTVYSGCLPTRLNPLAERTCFSQVMASQNCGCLLSLSSLLGMLVGGVELVAAIVLVAVNSWIQRQFLETLTKICSEASPPQFCDNKENYED